MLRWYILRVESRRMPQLIDELTPDECWRPTEKYYTKPKNKHKPVLMERPLIPGWLFVKEANYHRPLITPTFGALRYGKLGPIMIDDSDLEGLRKASEPPPTPHQPPPHPVKRIPIGTKVIILGLFNGLSGVITSYTSQGYARVDTNAFPITVHPSALTIDNS